MLVNLLVIFILQLVYVPIMTLRTIFLVKNMRKAASLLGIVETLISIFSLSIVFSGNQSITEKLVYAVGFGVGLYLGTHIENKLAIGYTTLYVNLMDRNEELIEALRNKGLGVTIFEGNGRDSKRYQLEILTKRNVEIEVMNFIEQYDPKAFIVSYEPRRFKGGFLVKAMKKNMKNSSLKNAPTHMGR
ncbi:hypothetical protein BABA_13612 [Neobacillus bataviensis LMG 21833]|uniref:UPF0316 protein BABA_13612 n=1 Tax=Neobacillus bataviensis LMG 21833 TaxID=1117379 RepID=K6DF42_9BACI|nr:DUF2179 domain-containing protein [Neobacillus bataviensis]EKN66929.1 hypothetical protein BABA_13612 [Neobacillus bataviensis LMG 21833]